MQRYDLQSETLNRTAEMVEHPEGDYVKFSDITPVPEPGPWLDQPDGEGGWLYEPEYDPTDWFVCRLFKCEKWGLYFFGSGGRYHITKMSKGRWQRIPQPTLPGEGVT